MPKLKLIKVSILQIAACRIVRCIILVLIEVSRHYPTTRASEIISNTSSIAATVVVDVEWCVS